MASRGSQPASPIDDGFPSPQLPQFPRASAGPPSVISSRMTDIASDDGHDAPGGSPDRSGRPKSGADKSSRPGTGKTAASSRAAWSRSNYASGPGARQSDTSGGSGQTSQTTGQTPSQTTSRSHVPSLTSNAFFRPMSSQKLQAQRGASRPTTRNKQQQAILDDGFTDFGGSVRRESVASMPIAEVQQSPQQSPHQDPQQDPQQDPSGADGIYSRPPPSRGTEITEQGTSDHITANTSPTHGHYPADSVSDSVRPLHRRADHLRVNVDKGYNERSGVPSPIKSPRSFRSSFLLATRSDTGRNRSTDGAEKLSSSASSPQLRSAHPQGAPHPRPATEPPKGLGRVYQYFDGNTVFCFGGRWQNTKQTPVNIATGVFVVVPCLLFYIFEAKWLWYNISPAIPITVAYLTFICVSSFIHASVSDPGILPRKLHQFPAIDEMDDPLRPGPPTNDWALIKSAESNTAAMEVPVKHCRTCDIWRPPRAHHCRLCDNCIEGHDHHCVWLNNCVGKRNYRFFFAFITSATMLSSYIVGTSLAQILIYRSREGISFGSAIAHFKGPFALVILGILAFCYPAALMGYHIFLMARGETTREYINSHKFVKAERFRAFTQGSVVRNLVAVLCRPRGPTYYNFKKRYQPGDQRLGSTRRNQRPRKNSQGLEMDVVQPVGGGGFQGPVTLSRGGAGRG